MVMNFIAHDVHNLHLVNFHLKNWNILYIRKKINEPSGSSVSISNSVMASDEDVPQCSNCCQPRCSNGIMQWFKCQHFQCVDTCKAILYCIECGEGELNPMIKNIMAEHPMMKKARNENDVKFIQILMFNKECRLMKMRWK